MTMRNLTQAIQSLVSNKGQISPLGKLMSAFPLLQLLLNFIAFYQFVLRPSFGSLCLILFFVYIFPLACFRIHNIFFPLQAGTFDLAEPKYCPWWGSYCLQLVFYSFPQLERILLLLPGAYAFWLRLWGANIGKNIIFTPRIELLDRPLLTIGDGSFFGAGVGISQHIIRPKDGKLVLQVKPVSIGKRVFLGAESRIAPGSCIDDDVVIPYGTVLGLNQHISNKNVGKLDSVLLNHNSTKQAAGDRK